MGSTGWSLEAQPGVPRERLYAEMRVAASVWGRTQPPAGPHGSPGETSELGKEHRRPSGQIHYTD